MPTKVQTIDIEGLRRYGHKDGQSCFLVSHGHAGSPFKIDRYDYLENAIKNAQKKVKEGFSVDVADVCKPAGERILAYGHEGKLLHWRSELEIR